jgi:pimeloyl-ACP methyl ester carboxylesterase
MHLVEAGEGGPIVMLHGWPQHWYLWRRVVPRLAPQTRVLCPDLRGFGWTEVPGRGYDRETMDRDVLALLDELGLDRVDLVGHDWAAGSTFFSRCAGRNGSGVPWRSPSCRRGPPEIAAACSRPGGSRTRSRWPSLSWGDGRWSTAWRGWRSARGSMHFRRERSKPSPIA